MNNKVILIGAGAQGRVTSDILFDSDIEVIGFLDDNKTLLGKDISGKFVLDTIENIHKFKDKNCRFIICTGNNYNRKLISQRINLDEKLYANAIHFSSVILRSSSIGYDNMIFANTIIGSNARIGNHTLINNGCIIEHDSVVGNYSALGPGCTLGGRVTIGDGVFISTGVTMNPRISIGNNSVIGSGSLIIHDIPEGVFAMGSPAKVVRKIEPHEMWDILL